MAFQEDCGVSGRVCIIVRDRLGHIVETQKVKNVVTLEGRKLLGSCFAGRAALTGRMKMAVGTGSTPARVADTSLVAESTRVDAFVPDLSVEDENGTLRVILRVNATFPALTSDVVEGLREAGIWLEQPGKDAVLFNRVVFPVVSRSSGLEISLSWEVLF